MSRSSPMWFFVASQQDGGTDSHLNDCQLDRSARAEGIGCGVLRKVFGSSLCIGVSTMPGATAFTRICCFAYSIPRLRVATSRPPLVIIGTAEFIPAIGWPTIVEVILFGTDLILSEMTLDDMDFE
jgi:hypothetical protein